MLDLATVRMQSCNYLVPLVIAVVLGYLCGFVFGNHAWAFGQSPAILVPLLGLGIAAAMWVFHGTVHSRSLPISATLVAVAGLWTIAAFRTVAQSSGYSYLVALIPVSLMLILAKPPRADEVLFAAQVLGLTVVLAALLGEIFVLGGLSGPDGGEEFLPRFGQELLGNTKYWTEVFLQENYAGPIAGLVLLFAFAQKGWYRWVIGIAAAWMVLASTSFTAVIGVVIGLLTLGVVSASPPWVRMSRRIRLIAATSLVLLLGAAAILRDPTINGRSTVWSSYWEVWHRNPLGGVGTLGIDEALRDHTIPLYWTHAHNWFFDALVRYGVLGLMLALCVAGMTVYLTCRTALSDGPKWPLAIAVAFVVMGLTEVPGDWLYWNIPLLWLVLAVLATQGYREGIKPSQDSRHLPSSMAAGS